MDWAQVAASAFPVAMVSGIFGIMQIKSANREKEHAEYVANLRDDLAGQDVKILALQQGQLESNDYIELLRRHISDGSPPPPPPYPDSMKGRR